MPYSTSNNHTHNFSIEFELLQIMTEGPHFIAFSGQLKQALYLRQKYLVQFLPNQNVLQINDFFQLNNIDGQARVLYTLQQTMRM